MSRYWFKVVTRPGHGLGFRLAGAPVEEVAEEAVSKRLKAILEEPGLGVLAVEEALLSRFPEPLLVRLLPFLTPTMLQGRGRRATRPGEAGIILQRLRVDCM